MRTIRATARGLAVVLGTSLPLLATAAEPGAAALNPKISLILDGVYAAFSADDEADVGGVILGPETELRPSGLSLGETELVMEANVDDRFHGWVTVALENEDGDTVVAVEEAYVNTLALPASLALKMGRFKSDVGYQNHIHAHAWEFVDAPLVYRALLGTQLQDDGVQLRWLAPTDLFVELGTEAYRGAAFPAGGEDRSGVNTLTAFAHAGGDAGSGGSWRAGLSYLTADADQRVTGEDVATAFTGRSRLGILDLVYKWAPNGNATLTHFIFNTEFFHRREDGSVVADPQGAADTSAYDGTQQGFYTQAVYQFMPRWRVGARYDWLKADNDVANPAPGTALALLADDGEAATRYSVMADFSNSEFSRLRVQYNRDASRPGGVKDDQIFLQYVFSLGAHPAHQF
jgi:hypothetical protein